MFELLTLLLGLAGHVIKFLFANLIGTILLALVGGMFLCGGCVGVATVEHESTPTKVSITEVEARGLPTKKWLEITDGYLFWPKEVEDLMETTENGQVVKRETKAHLVPVVSKAVLDSWMEEFHQNGGDSVFDYNQVRVVVKIDAADFEKAFPGVSGNPIDQAKPYTQATIVGEQRGFSGERAEMLKVLASHARNVKPWEQMMLVQYGSEPIGKGGMACMAFFGLLWFVPLGVVLVRQLTGARSGAKQYTGHGVTFQHPSDWKVAESPIEGGLAGWKIDLGPPHGFASIQVFNAEVPDLADHLKEGMEEGMKEKSAVDTEFTPSGAILGDQPARGFEMKARLLGIPQVGQMHAAVVGQRTVALTWAVAKENQPKVAPGLTMIRNSLAFSKS